MIGADYTNNDGQLVKGGVEINVRDAHFCGMRESNDSTPAPTTKPVVAPKPTVAPKPVVAPKPAIKPVMPKK